MVTERRTINRTLTRQFLKDEIEAKNITVRP